MKYFLTGHTGFKGSWLALLLRQMGHEVAGLSLDAEDKSLFRLAEIEPLLSEHIIGDVRDTELISRAIELVKPDFGLHMAAQPIVLRSYLDPVETFSTNVGGTLSFLDAWTSAAADKPALVITTDKVYKDKGTGPYVEDDELGGRDPYSASKSMADILTQSWKHAHPDLPLGVARAGNVIGAFDHASNRLLPDIMRALDLSERLEVRNASAVRPWQHVLDCLWGYLLFLDYLAMNGSEGAVSLNFGPDGSDFRTVGQVVELARSLAPALEVNRNNSATSSKETKVLRLDSSKARTQLRWNPKYDFTQSVTLSLDEWTWQDEPRKLVEKQIRDFLGVSD